MTKLFKVAQVLWLTFQVLEIRVMSKKIIRYHEVCPKTLVPSPFSYKKGTKIDGSDNISLLQLELEMLRGGELLSNFGSSTDSWRKYHLKSAYPCAIKRKVSILKKKSFREIESDFKTSPRHKPAEETSESFLRSTTSDTLSTEYGPLSSFSDISGESVNSENQTSDCYLRQKEATDEYRKHLLICFYAYHPVDKWKAIGLFKDDFLSHVNSHWLRAEPIRQSTHRLIALIYIFVMLVGCTGNGIVIYIFLRYRALRTPANFLLLNLAVCDFFMLAKLPVFIFNSYYSGPVLGSFGCQLYGFVGGLTGTGSIMTLTMIAIDRASAILHPMNPSWKITKSRAITMILFVWIYALFFSGLPLLGLNSYVPEGYLTSCSFDYLTTDIHSRIFVFVFFLAAWFLPLSIIIFSYFSIFRVVVQAGIRFRRPDTHKLHSSNARRREQEIKIAIIGIIVVSVWVLAWTPYAVIALLGITGNEDYISPHVSEIPALFCKTSSCINPFIYVISHPRFQRELKRERGRIRGLLNLSADTQISQTISRRATGRTFSDATNAQMVLMDCNLPMKPLRHQNPRRPLTRKSIQPPGKLYGVQIKVSSTSSYQSERYKYKETEV